MGASLGRSAAAHGPCGGRAEAGAGAGGVSHRRALCSGSRWNPGPGRPWGQPGDAAADGGAPPLQSESPSAASTCDRTSRLKHRQRDIEAFKQKDRQTVTVLRYMLT